MASLQSGVIREKREGLVEVSRFCPEKVYVELGLPEEVEVVNRVIFRTLSHDQGFSSQQQLYGGTYQASCTWFVAAAVSPGGHDRIPRRNLQYNIHASAQFRRHEICWEADSEDVSTRQWINAIRKGDTIQIIPKAQYPAWINFVQEAEIEIHYSKPFLETSDSTTSRPVVPLQPTKFHNRPCYRPLHKNAREVRLISLDSSAFDQPISCSLIYTSLLGSSTTPYEALSYCWGDARDKNEISLFTSGPEGLSEHSLSVTSALYSAMKSLRPQTGPSRILWVDAICIDQADLDERSSQVALMADIYLQADRVIVWLGEGDESTTKSIQTIKIINERYESFTRSGGSGSALATSHDLLMGDPSVFVDEWSLFESPWFRRTWVLQEIFNAKAAIVCSGKDILTWPMVLRVNKCIGLSDMKANSAHKALMPPIFGYVFESKDVTEAEILEILVKGLDLDATDPRDKIFAMLQFGSETRNMDLLPPDLIPDYHRSTAEVFSNFTKWWIVKHQSLRILSAIQALEGRTWQENFWGKTWKLAPNQPTWSWWYRGRSSWAIGILGLPINCPYRAAAETKPDIDMITNTQDYSILPLTGIRVGTIEKTMPYPYYKPPPNHKELHRAYVSIFDPLNLTGKNSSQLGSKYDHNYMDIDDPSLKQSNFYSHLKFSQRTGAVECHGNPFFSTAEGVVGLCPFAAKSGDLLVILYGGNVPYVLRACTGDDVERRGKYEFIGECYVQGYMDGHGIEEHEKKGVSTEVFDMV